MAEPRFAASPGAQGVPVKLTRTPTARSRFEAGIRVALMAAAAVVAAVALRNPKAPRAD